MAKIRVLDVAQGELEKGKLLAKLKKMGVKVKDEEMEEQGTRWGAEERVIRDDEGAELIEKRIKPTVIRRRAKAVEVPEEVSQEVQEELQEEVAEALEEQRPVAMEQMAGESPAEVAEEVPEEVTVEVIPAVREAAKPEKAKPEGAKLAEEEEEKRPEKKKAKKLKRMPEEFLPKKRVLKREIFQEAEQEMERRYVRGPREPGVKPFKAPKKKVEFIVSKKTVITTPKPIKRVIRIAETIMVSELAKRMGVKATEVIKKLLEVGAVANINQAINVLIELGFQLRRSWLAKHG